MSSASSFFQTSDLPSTSWAHCRLPVPMTPRPNTRSPAFPPKPLLSVTLLPLMATLSPSCGDEHRRAILDFSLSPAPCHRSQSSGWLSPHNASRRGHFSPLLLMRWSSQRLSRLDLYDRLPCLFSLMSPLAIPGPSQCRGLMVLLKRYCSNSPRALQFVGNRARVTAMDTYAPLLHVPPAREVSLELLDCARPGPAVEPLCWLFLVSGLFTPSLFQSTAGSPLP